MTAQLALVLRDAGIASSAAHADSVEPGWGDVAFRILSNYAKRRGDQRFTSEDFRDFLFSINFACPVPKALGSVFQKAARQHVIEQCGFVKSRDRHCSPIPEWRAA